MRKQGFAMGDLGGMSNLGEVDLSNTSPYWRCLHLGHCNHPDTVCTLRGSFGDFRRDVSRGDTEAFLEMESSYVVRVVQCWRLASCSPAIDSSTSKAGTWSGCQVGNNRMDFIMSVHHTIGS